MTTVNVTEFNASLNVKLYKEAVYLRGLFINRYSSIEFAIAELVSRAADHEAYKKLGHPPFGSAKKLKRLFKLLQSDGPISDYSNEFLPLLEEFKQYDEYRNFVAHAIMTAGEKKEILFKMYDHREGVYSVGQLRLEIQQLEKLTKLIGEVSQQVTKLVAKILKEMRFEMM